MKSNQLIDFLILICNNDQLMHVNMQRCWCKRLKKRRKNKEEKNKRPNNAQQRKNVVALSRTQSVAVAIIHIGVREERKMRGRERWR